MNMQAEQKAFVARFHEIVKRISFALEHTDAPRIDYDNQLPERMYSIFNDKEPPYWFHDEVSGLPPKIGCSLVAVKYARSCLIEDWENHPSTSSIISEMQQFIKDVENFRSAHCPKSDKKIPPNVEVDQNNQEVFLRRIYKIIGLISKAFNDADTFHPNREENDIFSQMRSRLRGSSPPPKWITEFPVEVSRALDAAMYARSSLQEGWGTSASISAAISEIEDFIRDAEEFRC